MASDSIALSFVIPLYHSADTIGAVVRDTEEDLAVMGCIARAGFCRIEGCCVLRIEINRLVVIGERVRSEEESDIVGHGGNGHR